MEEPRAPSFALAAPRRVAASSLVRRASRLALAGAGIVGFAALLTPSAAFADKISDAQAECRRKSEGDACSVYGERGACVERTLERPNGRSKRWLECSPGKRPKRRSKPAEDRTIDAAGPAGVLPALTTGGEASTGDEPGVWAYPLTFASE